VDMLASHVAAATAISVALPMFSGLVIRHQLDVIECPREENRFLEERLGGSASCLNTS
jgi:hypothetical protein